MNREERDERHEFSRGQAACVEADLIAQAMAEITDDAEILRLLSLYMPVERRLVIREMRALGIEIAAGAHK